MASTVKVLPVGSAVVSASRDGNKVPVPETCVWPFTFQSAVVASDTGLMQWVGGLSGVLVYITGIIGDTITAQTNNDGTQNNLVTVPALRIATQAVVTSITVDGVYLVPTPGYSYLQFNLARVGGTVTVVGNGFVTANDITIAEVNANVSQNIAQWGGNNVAAGNGVSGTGVVRVAQVSDGTGVLASVTAITNALPTGANLLGKTGIDQTTPGTTNGTTAVPTTAAAAQLAVAGSAAQVTSRVVKASAGTLFLAYGTNNSGATRYIQVFNAAAVPAEGVVPDLPPLQVGDKQSWSLNLGQFGQAFTTGIVIVASSTLATKTIGGADNFITATYI